MKRRFINILVVITYMVSVSYAQTNLDFETWGNDGIGSNNPIGWGTLNYDVLLGSPISTFQVTINPGELLSSAHMVTTAGYAASLGMFGFPDICGGTVQQSVPYTQKPTSMDFLYKSNIMVGDTGVIIAQLTHWDGSQTVLDGIAGMYFSGPAVNVWTPINETFTYFTTDTPDTMLITAISSQELVYSTPAAVVGSELYLDAVVIN